MNEWRAFVEANKFNGPTVKVLRVDDEHFAVLDHEYNLHLIVSIHALAGAVALCPHPPQRERPKPILYSDPTPRDVSRMSINIGDLDL